MENQAMLNHQNIGDRIAAAIEYAKKDFDPNMSQTKLAAMIGVSPQAVHNWIKDSKISRDRIPVIAHMCNVSVVWLLTGQGEMYVARRIDLIEDTKNYLYRVKDRDRIQGVSEPSTVPPPKGHTVLDRLAAMLESNDLTEQDLLALELIAKRFRKTPD